MKTIFSRLLLLLCTLGFALPAVRAEDLGAVKTRIQQRLAELDSLKASGAVGENNRGYIEVRGGGSAAGSVTAAENSDRAVVYAAIAQQTGSSVDMVARARARQIAQNSAPGVWLQRDNGEWYKK